MPSVEENDHRRVPPEGSKSQGAKLALTKYLGLVHTDSGIVLFDQFRFSPIRVAGNQVQARGFLDGLRNGGAEGLSPDAVDLLFAHGILQIEGREVLSPEEWPEDRWRAELGRYPFVLRVPTQLSQVKSVLRAIEKVLKHLREKHPEGGLPTLKVKFLWNSRDFARPLSAMAQVMPFIVQESTNLDSAKYYLEMPSLITVKQVVQIIEQCIVPPLRLNVWIAESLSKDDDATLQQLVEAGFCPHLIFRVTSANADRVVDDVERITRLLGPLGFTFGFSMPERYAHTSESLFAHALADPCDMRRIIQECYSSSLIEPSQLWLYQHLRERLRWPGYIYSCAASMGRAVFVSKDGLCSECHQGAAINPLSASSDPLTMLHRGMQRQPDRYWSASKKCTACSLRYACGGICTYATAGIRSQEVSDHIHELHCIGRSYTLTCFLEDATIPVPAKEKSTDRWFLDSLDGELILQKREAQQ